MEYEQLLYEVDERVAILTLNRPEKLNALSPRLWEEIDAGIRQADADTDVRAVVLTGAGRAFSAGIDMSTPGRRASAAPRPDGLVRGRAGR